MSFLQKIKGYRTVIVAVAKVVLGLSVVFGVVNAADVAGIKDVTDAAAANVLAGSTLTVAGVITALMRLFTTSALSQKT